jgi:inner membrane protein
MPSPIAHSATGYAIARLFLVDRKSSLGNKNSFLQINYGILVAVAADLDFIPQLITGEKYHHGFTHSLTFAIAVSVCVYSLRYCLKKQLSTRLLWLTLMLYGSHLLLDFFTQGGNGIQLLWPFTTATFKSPISLFPSTYWSEPLFQHPGHLIFIAVELGYAALLLAGVGFLNRSRTQKSQGLKWRNRF